MCMHAFSYVYPSKVGYVVDERNDILLETIRGCDKLKLH